MRFLHGLKAAEGSLGIVAHGAPCVAGATRLVMTTGICIRTPPGVPSTWSEMPVKTGGIFIREDTMKTLTALCVLLLAGCAMTPTQKKVAYVAGAVVVTAVAISADNGKRDNSYCGDGVSFCGPIKP